MSALQTIDYVPLAPALVAAVGAVAVLVADLVLPLRVRPAVLGVAVAAAAGSLVASLALIGQRRSTFCTPPTTLPGNVEVGQSCSYVLDGFTLFFFVLLSAAAVGTLLVTAAFARDASLPPGEYGFLLLASLTGALALAGARDLITLLVGLETLTLPTYALVGLRRGSGRGAEAALKYLLVSVVASAVTLLGVAFVYGLTGTVHFDRINAVLAARPDIRALPLGAAAVVLVLAGFAFKLAAVPFHWWAPDVYQGAPTPVATYLATVSKAGGAAGLLLLSVVAFPAYWRVWGWVLALLAVASMTLGNLVALRQRHAVRLLAWSSVAHSGYLLVPLGAVGMAGPGELTTAVTATLGYLGFYVAVNLGAFACVTAVGRRLPGNAIDSYRGLVAHSPALAAALAFFLLGLAGLPPTLAGLVAKVVVVRAALLGGAGWLAVAVAVNTVVGLAYYLRLAALPFRVGPTEAPEQADVAAGVVTAVASAGVVPAGVVSAGVVSAGVVSAGVVSAGVVSAGPAVGGEPDGPGGAPRGGLAAGAVRMPAVLAVAIGLAALVALVLGVLPQLVLGGSAFPGH
jgi:NADH-quinone oxidoreductase subunit N